MQGVAAPRQLGPFHSRLPHSPPCCACRATEWIDMMCGTVLGAMPDFKWTPVSDGIVDDEGWAIVIVKVGRVGAGAFVWLQPAAGRCRRLVPGASAHASRCWCVAGGVRGVSYHTDTCWGGEGAANGRYPAGWLQVTGHHTGAPFSLQLPGASLPEVSGAAVAQAAALRCAGTCRSRRVITCAIHKE